MGHLTLVHPALIKRRPLVHHQIKKAFHHKPLGIHKLYDPKYSLWHKCFWVLVIILSIASFALHIAQRIMAFFDQPMRLQLIIEEKPQVRFPPVGLCSAALTTHIQKNRPKFGRVISYDELYYTLNIDPAAVTVKRQCYKLSENADNDDCDFQPVEGRLRLKFESTIYGRCLILETRKTENYVGPFSYLSLRWNISRKESNSFGIHKKYYYFYLVNPSWPPNYSILLLSERIEVGKDQLIRISTREFRFQNSFRKPCTEKTQRFQRCIRTCTDQQIENLTSCRLAFMMSSDHPSCKNFNQTLETLNKVVKVYGTLHYAECNCSRPCTNTVHTVYMDTSSEIANNSGGITLLLSDESQEILKEEAAYSKSELFSDIGGALGLYLGISVITIFDMIDWFVQNIVNGRLNT